MVKSNRVYLGNGSGRVNVLGEPLGVPSTSAMGVEAAELLHGLKI